LLCLGYLDVFLRNGVPTAQQGRALRLLRITETFRVLRAFRFVDQLRVMLRCILGSMTSVVWSAVLLLGVTFVFANAVVLQLLKLESQVHLTSSEITQIKASFGSVQQALLTLIIDVTGGNDWGDHFRLISKVGRSAAMIFFSYFILVWLSLSNIITSIFIERAMKLATPDLEDAVREKQWEQVSTAKELKNLFKHISKSDAEDLTCDALCEALHDERLNTYFEVRGLRIHDARAFF